jgi:F-type H+-transporting ATPase subunit b
MGDVLATIGFDVKFFIFNLINFLIVSWLLYRFFFKKIFKVIEERQKIINQGIQDKEKYESLLLETQKQSEQIILNAKKEASDLTEAQKDGAKLVAAKIISDAHNESEHISEKAKAVLEQERMASLKRIQKDAIDIVISATRKLSKDSQLGEKIDVNQAKEALQSQDIK